MKPYPALKLGCLLLTSLALPGKAFALQCSYTVNNDWSSGFTANITVTNDTTSAINGWQVQWQHNGGSTVTSSWNATTSGTNPYTARNVDWNGNIAPGASQSFGVQGNGDNSTATIVGCITDGGSASSRSSARVSSSAPRSSSSSAAVSSGLSSSVASSKMSSSKVSSSSVSSRAASSSPKCRGCRSAT